MDIKIDRSDVWGDPWENRESLLMYCRKFSEVGDDETAHVVYLYGQGGVVSLRRQVRKIFFQGFIWHIIITN